jgi:GTP-binding protein HflX
MTLDEIGAGHIPVVSVLNKIDRLHSPESAQETMRQVPKSVAISAAQGTAIPEMLALVHQELYESFAPIQVNLPYQQGALISLFHEMGQVERIEHGRSGVLMKGHIPGRLVAQFKPWQVKKFAFEKEKEPEEQAE